MNNSFREQEPGTDQDPKRFLAGLTIFARIIERLAGLIKRDGSKRRQASIPIAWEVNKYQPQVAVIINNQSINKEKRR